MAGHGGRRPGAGRKPGPQAIKRLTVKLDRQREKLADELDKMEANDGVSIWQRLAELTKNPDPTVALAAIQIAARHTVPVPAQKANLATIQLPEIRTVQDAADALLQLSAAGAAGLIEPLQLKETSTAIARAVDCLNTVTVERDIELLKTENTELRKQLNHRGQQALAYDYEVVSGIEDAQAHINGHASAAEGTSQ